MWETLEGLWPCHVSFRGTIRVGQGYGLGKDGQIASSIPLSLPYLFVLM
jgi:hypothetical protein